MRIERFEDLESWCEARKLMQIVYRLTGKNAFLGDQALTWQIRDAAVSVMANIAEASARDSFEDKRRLLDVSLGSGKEVQSHLYVALDHASGNQEAFEEASRQADLVGKLIKGAIKQPRSPERDTALRQPGRAEGSGDEQISGVRLGSRGRSRTVEAPNAFLFRPNHRTTEPANYRTPLVPGVQPERRTAERSCIQWSDV